MGVEYTKLHLTREGFLYPLVQSHTWAPANVHLLISLQSGRLSHLEMVFSPSLFPPMQQWLKERSRILKFLSEDCWHRTDLFHLKHMLGSVSSHPSPALVQTHHKWYKPENQRENSRGQPVSAARQRINFQYLKDLFSKDSSLIPVTAETKVKEFHLFQLRSEDTFHRCKMTLHPKLLFYITIYILLISLSSCACGHDFSARPPRRSSNSSSLHSIHNTYLPVIKVNRGTVSLPFLVPGFGISLLSHISWQCTVVSPATSPSVILVFPAGWPISAADNVDTRCQLTLPTKCIIPQCLLFLLVIPLMRVYFGSRKGKEQNKMK